MSNAISTLLQFSPYDHSWLAQFFSLVVLPFAHEDLAIILGAYIVVNKIMPVGLVALSIYGGMVASDFALYGIGAGARRLPWLCRLAVDHRVRSVAETLNRNLFGVVALCRVVPGVVFIAMVACGWTRVPFGRFSVASFLVSALYLPLMLYLVVVFGDAMDDHVGWWAWPFLVFVLASLDLWRRRVFAFQPASEGAVEGAVSGAAVSDRWMWARNAQRRGIVLGRRIASVLLCLPLMLSWLRFAWRHRSLTLPTVANPRLQGRGGSGDLLSDYLVDVAIQERSWIADFVVVTRGGGSAALYADLDRAVQSIGNAGLTFPLIAKPDLKWHGQGVRRIDDVQALREYLRDFPGGARLVLQRFVPYAGEAAVLYARLPGAESGRILSLTFRHHPQVVGAPSAPTIAHDARRYITPALEARFDAIAKSMSEFHYGRFDLRFAAADDLKRGENFSIVGVNGIGAEAIDVLATHLPVAEAYRRLVDQQRIVFLIGERNRARGFKPAGCADFFRSLVRRTALMRRYPASA